MSREKITFKQMHNLDADEIRDILGFVMGWCASDPTFQEGMTAAYKSVMRARIRRAEQDPEGLALVQAIHDRKALHDHRVGVACHTCATYNRD